jgi:hypothetical protein
MGGFRQTRALKRGLLSAVLLGLLSACATEPSVVNPRLSESHLPLPPVAETQTSLVRFDTTPFPYHGVNPATGRPFMDVAENGRLGHSSARNGTLWEDQTYNEKRVLLSLPQGFDPRRPAAIVVFLHGNEATLERDVIARQGVARQLAASGFNGVLVAPQFALDARDSSAGRFWEAGLFHQFLHEASRRLADLYGTRDADFVFEDAPVILVAYSGGYLPAAAALRYGGAGARIRGIIMLDALYGEFDTIERFIEHRGRGFFVSLHGLSTRDGNHDLENRLSARGIAFDTALHPSIGPGSLVFIDNGDGVPHGDFVTGALKGDPLADVLSRLKGFSRSPPIGPVASEGE